MLKNIFDLQMFAEEADGSADTGSLAMDTGAEATEVAETSIAPEEAEVESFDSLIKGKYKADYDAKIKDTIDKRFKKQKEIEARYDKATPILEMVARKYGIDTSDMKNLDLDALNKAMYDDNSLYEEEAFKRGMDVETLKQIKQVEAENARLKAEQMARMQADDNAAKWRELQEDEAQLKQIYPEFSLENEVQSEEFGRLLATLKNAGFKDAMQRAYEVVHKDEILSKGIQYAVQHTADNISRSIQSGSRRPTENGMSNQAPASANGLDPSKLTKEQIADIRRRAERGERITFV